jgi:hypothetical protein
MNTVMRTIGGAVGGQVAASILAASLLGDGLPNEQGYTLSFVVMALALAAGIIASLAVPGGRPHHLSAVTTASPQALGD